MSGVTQVIGWQGKAHHLDIKPEGPLLHALIPRYPGHSRSFSKALLHACRMSGQSILGFENPHVFFIYSFLPLDKQ